MAKDTLKARIWHKIIHKLNASGLEYVLVGAAALVAYGLPRSTLDIDIYIPAKTGSLRKIFQIAHTLGLASQQEAILKIAHQPNLFIGQWICFSYKGQDVLDVYLDKEKEFKKLYRNSKRKKDKEISIRIASLHDLMAMKKESGRPIDLADIKLIEEAKKYKINLG